MRKEYDERYGDFHRWLKRRPCIIAKRCFGPVAGHHLKTIGAGGMDAENEIPLCAGHHIEVHTTGPSRFEKKYEVDLDLEAANAWSRYCDETPWTR